MQNTYYVIQEMFTQSLWIDLIVYEFTEEFREEAKERIKVYCSAYPERIFRLVTIHTLGEK